MSAHHPLLPKKALERVETAGLADAQTLLADFAGAGLIKTYALVRATAAAGQPAVTVRDAVVPAEVWQRIIAARMVSKILSGGTVRLAGSGLIGGEPEVEITGVSISEGSLTKVLERYCSQPTPAQLNRLSATSVEEPIVEQKDEPSSTSDETASPKILPPILKGALAATVAQTMQSTGLGRTKINELMNDDILVRTKVGRRTLITVESIERLVGAIES